MYGMVCCDLLLVLNDIRLLFVWTFFIRPVGNREWTVGYWHLATQNCSTEACHEWFVA